MYQNAQMMYGSWDMVRDRYHHFWHMYQNAQMMYGSLDMVRDRQTEKVTI